MIIDDLPVSFIDDDEAPPEVWARVAGPLEASDQGRIRYDGQILETYKGHGGYVYVDIPAPQGPAPLLVHRLVVRAFRGEVVQESRGGKKRKIPIKHRNGNRGDCRLENLVYSGPQAYYKAQRGKPSITRRARKATPEKMQVFWEMVRAGRSPAMIAATLGVSVPTIYRWKKAVETKAGRLLLSDPGEEFRGCRDGKACGCRCHRPKGAPDPDAPQPNFPGAFPPE